MRRQLLLVTAMSIAFGLPLRDLLALVLGKGDLRSMFCLIVFSIVVLILGSSFYSSCYHLSLRHYLTQAYLTNPTENSFRAYLTEQSFRHHLSRLDDNADDNNLRIDHIRSLTTPKNNSPSSASSSIFASENWPSFHFANRASISLRTPKHVFHSFGIFTIATILPSTKASERESHNAMISDSWYIGAFGRWWGCGVFEDWYQDVIAGPKDEEGWTSGILNMKRLDMLQDYKGTHCGSFFSFTSVKSFFHQCRPSALIICLHIWRPDPPHDSGIERGPLREVNPFV